MASRKELRRRMHATARANSKPAKPDAVIPGDDDVRTVDEDVAGEDELGELA